MEPGAFQLAKTYIMEAGGQPAKAISMLTDGYVGESPCCCRCVGCAAASLCNMSADAAALYQRLVVVRGLVAMFVDPWSYACLPCRLCCNGQLTVQLAA